MATFHNTNNPNNPNNMADTTFADTLPQLPGQPLRRQFNELHPKDQTIKLNRKARIESNWSCNVQNCIPMHIRPRMELKKGAKARVGDIGVSEEIWWNWSVELLRSLEELSTMTATKLDFAQEILHVEVEQRQQNKKHPQRKIAELLLGDVQRIIDGMRRSNCAVDMVGQNGQNGGSDAEEMAYDEEEGEYANEGEVDDYRETVETNNHDDDDDDVDVGVAATNTPPHHVASSSASRRFGAGPAHGGNTNTVRTPQSSSSARDRSGRVVKVRHAPAYSNARALEIRARAVRLRAQANRLEAEAMELEVDAADLRSQLEQS